MPRTWSSLAENKLKNANSKPHVNTHSTMSGKKTELSWNKKPMTDYYSYYTLSKNIAIWIKKKMNF